MKFRWALASVCCTARAFSLSVGQEREAANSVLAVGSGAGWIGDAWGEDTDEERTELGDAWREDPGEERMEFGGGPARGGSTPRTTQFPHGDSDSASATERAVQRLQKVVDDPDVDMETFDFQYVMKTAFPTCDNLTNNVVERLNKTFDFLVEDFMFKSKVCTADWNSTVCHEVLSGVMVNMTFVALWSPIGAVTGPFAPLLWKFELRVWEYTRGFLARMVEPVVTDIQDAVTERNPDFSSREEGIAQAVETIKEKKEKIVTYLGKHCEPLCHTLAR
mmetsp:Transcript_57708/g.162750  ORF Transcript_57708/g.162750 Transcript_57708/m.162750 type:complete len:277 (-) Transcript_57708:218-1048(-)